MLILTSETIFAYKTHTELPPILYPLISLHNLIYSPPLTIHCPGILILTDRRAVQANLSKLYFYTKNRKINTISLKTLSTVRRIPSNSNFHYEGMHVKKISETRPGHFFLQDYCPQIYQTEIYIFRRD